MQEISKEFPLVSIVIPLFNAESYIKNTICSILSQSYRNIEVIVINDGSTDSSEMIVKSLVDQNNEIKLFNTTNKGVSSARNYGLEISKGKYIVFFDADDIMLPSYIYNRLNFLENNLDYIGVSTKLEFINDVGDKIDNFNCYGPSENSLEEILFFDKKVASVPSNILFSKNFLISNNIKFDQSLSSTADKYFIVNVSLHGKLKCLWEEADFYYRLHSNSMYNDARKNKKIIYDNFIYVKKIQTISFQFGSLKSKANFINHMMIAKATLKNLNFHIFFKLFLSNPNF